ncbi:MAG: hypothetical protein AAF208_14510 [Cyanobacteria bacterium P01_A01_bin.45]
MEIYSKNLFYKKYTYDMVLPLQAPPCSHSKLVISYVLAILTARSRSSIFIYEVALLEISV